MQGSAMWLSLEVVDLLLTQTTVRQSSESPNSADSEQADPRRCGKFPHKCDLKVYVN
jgi:hypothetical protein